MFCGQVGEGSLTASIHSQGRCNRELLFEVPCNLWPVTCSLFFRALQRINGLVGGENEHFVISQKICSNDARREREVRYRLQAGNIIEVDDTLAVINQHFVSGYGKGPRLAENLALLLS